MPLIDDFTGRPEADGPDSDPYAVERDLLNLPALPWTALVVTFFTIVLSFGIAHTVMLATHEKNKLIAQTLAAQDHQAQLASLVPAADLDPEEAILIPGGPFTLGRDPGDDSVNSDSTPAQQVDVPPFYIGRYEVTNAQYQGFVEDVGYIPPPHWRGKTTFPEGQGRLPVTYVNQIQAAAYAEWRGGRLCSEVEWEKAARGDQDDRIYPYGNDYAPEKANIDYLQNALTPVGAFPASASPYGVEDMMGNVYEWTSSHYGPYPGNEDDASNYATYVVDDQGNVSIDPDQDSYYVVARGGCWKCDPWSSQLTTRNATRPDYAADFFGIRVCWDAKLDSHGPNNPYK